MREAFFKLFYSAFNMNTSVLPLDQFFKVCFRDCLRLTGNLKL